MQWRALPARTLSIFLLSLFSVTGITAAQVSPIEPGSERPMFRHIPGKLHAPLYTFEATTTPLKTWNGYFHHNGKLYKYNMVGTAPFTGTSTTVSVELVPVRIIIVNKDGVKTTYDPHHVLTNGYSVITNTVASPLFKKIGFSSGGVNMGTTQYIDAYQRANFWGTVRNHTGYHLLLGGPTVLAQQTLSPPSNKGKKGNAFGFSAGLIDMAWFDAQAQSLVKKLGTKPNTLVIFLTFNIYLTDTGTCCVGGYHSATGSTTAPQAYVQATYVDHEGVFAQDVSALSHEIGEWADDPLVVNTNGNNTPCGILENGDPLQNDYNYGGHRYKGTNGFTYNLQDLVTLPYFGATPSTSVNGEFTFKGEGLTVCENGP
ncbi:MAG TPA: hypothetical protein VH596_06945 [Terriglobales bacterium]|jgi:hypothetical protein